MKNLLIALATLLLVVPAAAQTPEADPPEPQAEQVVYCHTCGVELTPQTRASVHDGEDHPICADCAAEESDEEAPGPFSLWTTNRLLGDLGGVRTDMEDAGISFGLTYQSQLMFNTRGGLETKNGHDFAGSYNLTMELDFDKMGLVPGGSFFVEAKGTYGGGDSDFNREKIGSLSKANHNADPEEAIFVNKYWWRQRLYDDRLELRLGHIDTFKDLFDVSSLAGSDENQFLNTWLVGNPTIPHTNALGLYANVWPTDELYLRAAVIDANAGGQGRHTRIRTAFHGPARFNTYFELGYTPTFESARGNLKGRYRAGVWYDARTRSVLGRSARHIQTGDVGFYLGFDQMIWKENPEAAADQQGVSVFARYGFAHGDVNLIEHFWSTGLQYEGLIPTRDKDVLGFGVAQGILSNDAPRRARADRETVYEMYYKYWLTPWCFVGPDLQMITNPGGTKDDRDTFIAGIRMRIFF